MSQPTKRLLAGMVRIRPLRGIGRFLKLLGNLLTAGNTPFLRSARPGHFYSPLPDIRACRADADRLFDTDLKECPGVDLSEHAQLELLKELSRYSADFPFEDAPNSRYRFHCNNGFFGGGEALILYCMLRHFQPAGIVEVGSGYTSALMLDARDLFLPETRLTFIEPHPARLFSLLRQADKERCRILVEPVQNTDQAVFRELAANDFVFLDSSHVAKIGSDVVHILANILPQLKPGTIIHFHDIYWPFEYPKDWVLDKGRAWNEAYFLRSFLQFNSDFEILFFNSFVARACDNDLRKTMPALFKEPGGSIWLRRRADDS